MRYKIEYVGRGKASESSAADGSEKADGDPGIAPGPSRGKKITLSIFQSIIYSVIQSFKSVHRLTVGDQEDEGKMPIEISHDYNNHILFWTL